jgi:tryptophanyl-tRNA synthetase
VLPVDRKQAKRILTGDRPTGPLHLGHYVGSLQNRVRLQYEYETYVLIADIQALTTNWEHPEKLTEDIRNVTIDYLAVGIDPSIATICVQSMIPEIAELTVYYGLITNMNKLRHNPTTKSEAQSLGYIRGEDLLRGFDQLTYGFFGYPVSQAADITIFNADLVPVGRDQAPHIELTRDIVKKFNQLYGYTIKEPEALVSDVFLTALDGKTKMSKSLGNAIYLGDTREEIRAKVMAAVTDPARIHPTDPGHPEVCNVFRYHQIFNPEDAPDIENRCTHGKLGCVPCKKKLADVLDVFLEPVRQKRRQYIVNPKEVEEILQKGTAAARKVSQDTIERVRKAMKIDYFPQ